MNDLDEAASIVNKSGVVIFPTDTIFGIGCRIDKEDAVRRVFCIRNRPEEKAVLVLVDSIAMAQEYLLPIPSDVQVKLMEKYWPNGLTIILPCKKEKVPSIVRGAGKTLAVRQTNHPVIRTLLKKVKVPLIAPSANFSGEHSPITFSDINPKLISLVDFVLPGNSYGKQSSTIIDCSQRPWRIIREGAVKVHDVM